MASSPVARATGRVAVPVLGLFWLAVTTVPFLFMVMTSFKSQQESFSSSVWALPEALDLVNYNDVLSGPFLTYFKNSVMVVVISVLLIMLISSMAAFAFARMRFRFNEAIFGLIVAGMIVPIHITLVPIYLMTRQLGLYDSQFALIGPYVATSLPISVFILTEFMRQIPKELEEAARLDGCGPFAIFFKVFLPLSGPGLSTIAIYNGIMLWNEFIFAYVLTSSTGTRTLPLAIWDYQGQYTANIPAILTVVTLTSLPLVVAYAFGQEKIVKGMMAGSLKG
ncbi:carbohydrate ABC transporter permease [Pleomorphomonas diazotrophica]|uniref:Carbohydrate ABC transporter permease n=1 Tax=Pleomorphomonas diazotrophica TaxID=1166257 RepID=A0A1I4V337_9HYPH|nr:carbohydrate ABC transporter permease [Pleomorphomonas diazotrophica]PKR88723.1 carbohydrate ABC transporter permease [Pleomorphomonas diazotrophica]SFM95657.1 carbohydrate ABC transporter membrane protein 2, CUT1 family [Pleomorphomonas diazotrophica]